MSNPIQLATASDLEAVSACVHHAYAHYVERIGRPPAPMGANYAELIAQRAVYVLRGAGGAGVQGLIVLHAEQASLFIENVAVHPAYQHQGLGRQLLAFAEEQARQLGLREMTLYTHALMTENIALYTRLGYEEVERYVGEGFVRVSMRKRLA